MSKFLSIVWILFLPLAGSAQEAAGSAGTSSNLLLRFGSGTRASGVSGAFTGFAEDASTLLYNPGGLPNLKNSSLQLNHAEWFEDIRIDNLIYAHRLNYTTSIGVGITHMWMPSIQGKDQYGQATESFDVSSSILQVGIGHKIHRASYIGVNIKYFQDQLANYTATGFAFDAGYFMHTAIRGLTFGISAQNLGQKIKYASAKQNLPVTYRAGFAYRLFSNQVTFSADLAKAADTDYQLMTGIEFNYQRFFFLRIGNQYANQQAFSPAYGVGFIISEKFETNYTFSSFEDLGATHRIGVSFHFNSPERLNSYTKSDTRSTSRPNTFKGDMKVSLIGNELLVSWKTINSAKYILYAKAENQNDWIKINSEPIRKNFMKFKKPRYAGKYAFKVKYIIDNQERPYPKEATFDVKE